MSLLLNSGEPLLPAHLAPVMRKGRSKLAGGGNLVCQSQKWAEPSESDKHQDIARQPYRSREHGPDTASQESSSRSPSKEGDDTTEPE